MRWMLLVLLLGVAVVPGVALAAPAAPAAVAVDRVVAVVGNTPIAASQVQFEREVGERIAGDGCTPSFGRLLCEERAPLERLIFRETLRQAGLAKGIEVSLGTLETADGAFEHTFPVRDGKRQFLARWGLGAGDFREFLLDVARLDQAIEVAVGRLVREVSEEEERRYYGENADTIFGGRPYEEVAAMVSRRYYALKFERTYGSWASELRASSRVRYIGR
ncbi:MAG: hypothetical protein KDA24_03460 [Deltaproteobacteria bacterium]|nr:hypothetical protein [Deltaproteobacteria bacterium]